MQINIQGHGIELTDPLRDYAHKKIGRLNEFYRNIQKIQITLDVRDIDDFKRSQVAEVTLWAAGKKVIRASEAAADMYASIDLVFEELERQVKKHKDKHVKEVRRDASKIKQFLRSFVPALGKPAEPELVRVKRFDIMNMTEAEAVAEKNKLSQEFFVYRDAETGLINVISKEGVTNPSNCSPLSEQEAVRMMKNQNVSFLPFLNSITSEMNVVYKRKSGNLGLIEPAV